jgi:glutaredoxin-related protein
MTNARSQYCQQILIRWREQSKSTKINYQPVEDMSISAGNKKLFLQLRDTSIGFLQLLFNSALSFTVLLSNKKE